MTKCDWARGGRAPRLLCVDDSAAMRNRVLELLRDEYEIAVANNGVEGLRAAKASPPDVVLSDYDMPELNGLQLLRAMKSDPALRAIPFIVLTANAQSEMVTKCLNAGADDFLVKPVAELFFACPSGSRDKIGRICSS